MNGQAIENPFMVRDVVRHSGVVRPGINIAPDNSKLKKPRNVEYFTPDPETFDDPRDYRRVMEFADEEGRIRRLPIWFHSDDLDLVAPNGLCLFQAGGLACRAVNAAGEQGLAIRYEQGERKVVKCDPDNCPDHMSGACTFSGRLYFFVPGQMSPNPLLLPTGSWNSFRNIISALENLKRVRGSIKGLHEGKPFLSLIKVRKKVRRTAPDGGTMMAPQWLIALSLDVPMDELLSPSISPATLPRTADRPSAGRETGPDEPQRPNGNGSTPEENTLSIGELRNRIVKLVGEMGLAAEDMKLWAVKRFGKEVREMDQTHLRRVLDLLQDAQQGRSLRLIHEIEVAKALEDLKAADFGVFEAWLEPQGLNWNEALAKGMGADVAAMFRDQAISAPEKILAPQPQAQEA